MSDDLTRRSFAVFKQALELDADAQAAFVLDACGDDTGLRQRVETLVTAIDRTKGFLETPVARREPASALSSHLLKPGDVVVQRGTNHAWMNTGSEMAVLVAVLIDTPK